MYNPPIRIIINYFEKTRHETNQVFCCWWTQATKINIKTYTFWDISNSGYYVNIWYSVNLNILTKSKIIHLFNMSMNITVTNLKIVMKLS